MRALPIALACTLPAVTQTVVDPAQALAAGATAEKSGAYAEALRQYTLGAEAGDAACMNALGDLHYDGHGVPQSFPQAVAWYRKAAEKGFAKGQSNLGYCYATGQGVAKDPVEAVKWHRLGAEQGYPNAQNNLAVALIEGAGVAKAPLEAEAWFLKAAQQGYVRAQYHLGNHYWKGSFGTRDPFKAYTWFKQAADQEDLPAMDFLANLLSGRLADLPKDVPYDPKGAYQLYLKAATKGFAPSQMVLGQTCILGRFRTREGWTTLEGLLKVDLPQARDWYLKAAAQGQAGAYLQLGHLIVDYKFPTADGAEAARYYQAAAQAGEPKSHHYLAELYRKGELLPQNPSIAADWAMKGMKKGVDECWGDLENLLCDGPPDRKVLQAIETLAQEGHPKAAFWVGIAYLTAENPENAWCIKHHPWAVRLVKTLGIQGDLDRGYALLVQAAKGRVEVAYEFAVQAYEEGLGGVTKDPAEAARWRARRDAFEAWVHRVR